MARDTSRRGTPRGRALPAQGRAQSRPRQAARPAARPTGRPAARPAARPQRAPKAKAATGRPAFLDNAAAARRGAPQGGKERRERYQRGQSAKAVVGVVGGVAVLAVVLVVAYFVLRSSSAFAIQNVVCEPTEHVSESDIQNLLSVPEGSTLLNFDSAPMGPAEEVRA